MKRWNGWGDDMITYEVPGPAEAYLGEILGSLQSHPDASLADVLKAIPASHLPSHPLVDATVETRLLHARGHSTRDWVALRSGRIGKVPDGVAFPGTEQDVRDLLDYARRAGARVIPYGGGTSVVGHITPLEDDSPVLTLSMEKMKRLVDLDEIGRTATFEAGVAGPELEKTLTARGYTLGHFPQSFEYSTLGGWIASRSSGQQSYRYGRIEQLFAGGRMETPRGTLELPHFPASSAGPDLKEVVLGSEGRMGVITQAKVKIRMLPEAEEFHGVFFKSWEAGVVAVREIVQAETPVSMLRLSNPLETWTTLVLSGKSWINAADKGLRLMGYGDKRCMLIFAVTGKRNLVQRTRAQAISICRKFGGLFVGEVVGHTWEKARFRSVYIRNTLWELGVATDTLESVFPWSRVEEASKAIPAKIVETAQSFNEKVLAFDHLSHIYRDGATVYTTFLYRRPADPDELLSHWKLMKEAASLTLQSLGGTISHQHGIGTDHAPFLPAEKGTLGMDAIRSLCKSFDPDGMMNPGKLFAG